MTVPRAVTKGSAVTNSVESMSLPRHRWYPIKEGFSPSLIADSFHELKSHPRKRVLAIEPFSGSGTVPVECVRLGIECLAFEVNPFLAFVSRTKVRQVNPNELREQREIILRGIETPIVSLLEDYSTFCERRDRTKWLFNRRVLRAFAGAWRSIDKCAPKLLGFFRLALLRAVMDNCNAYPDGKCLRYKRLKNYSCFTQDSLALDFEGHCTRIEEDLISTPFNRGLARVLCMDSRRLATFDTQRRFDLCVTSPPYLNSFDYSDVYRPETFLGGFVSNNYELMRIRLRTLRSHLQANWKAPVKTDFGTLYAKVVKEVLVRQDKLWSKRIPEMIQAYFEDMEQLVSALAARANKGASLKIAVGTSAYGGIVVPVDLILAEIAERSGWELREIQVVRRLRSSAELWKHENHQKEVPELRESIVILRYPTGSGTARAKGTM